MTAVTEIYVILKTFEYFCFLYFSFLNFFSFLGHNKPAEEELAKGPQEAGLCVCAGTTKT